MLKATGIVRRIDDLGRVVIPKELRRVHGIEEGDPLEFFVDGDRIVLRRYQPGCFFCGNNESLNLFHGKQICTHCIAKASELTKSN